MDVMLDSDRCPKPLRNPGEIGELDITLEPKTKEDEETVFPSLTKPKREPQVSKNSRYHGVHHNRGAEVWCLVFGPWCLADDGRGRREQKERRTKS
jgi:hypothetical protein